MTARHKVPEHERDRFGGALLAPAVGNRRFHHPPVERRLHGLAVEHIRHAKWMIQGLTDMEVAERFDAALPEELRTLVWEQINEAGDWPLGRS